MQAVEYLEYCFDDNLTYVDIKGYLSKLPLFLKSLFDIKCISIYELEYVLIIQKEKTKINLFDYKDYKAHIEKVFNRESILCAESLNTHQVEALIKNGYMFVCGNKQIFLPKVGIILKKEKDKKISYTFTPQTQLCALYIFYNIEKEFTVAFLTKALKINSMAVNRAMEFLIDIGIINKYKKGKECKYKVNKNKKEYFIAIKKYLINPIQKEIIIDDNINLDTIAGYSALSEYTNIQDNDLKTYAIYKKNNKEKESIKFSNILKLQIWKYNPDILKLSGRVDPISLLASFIGEEKDARSEIELKHLEGDIKDGIF